LAKQFALDHPHGEVTRSHAGGRREGGGDAGGLAGEPTLRDLAQESVRTRVASNVTSST